MTLTPRPSAHLLVLACATALACGSNSRTPQGDNGESGAGGTSSGLGNGGSFNFLDSTGGSSSGSDGTGATSGASSRDAGVSGSTGFFPPDASYPDLSFPFDPARITPDACATVRGQATEAQRPMDIIISIDNSGSMSSEIEEVQTRINSNFYTILEDSGIDYRVIMVSRYGDISASIGGSNFPIHISPPLGGSSCPQVAPNDPCEPLSTPAHGKYYHYSADIESKDMWQKLLGGLFLTDELQSGGGNRDSGDQFFPWAPFAPNGYSAFLRPDSFKVIVGISDDGIDGSEYSGQFSGVTWDFDTIAGGANYGAEASEFDTAIRSIAPEHFGALPNDEDRNYKYYAIVGFESGGYVTLDPADPVVTTTCQKVDGNNGETPGQGHQELSRLTGGLRYSSCRTTNYDPIFTAIAQAVVAGSRVPCEFDFPAPPDGKLIDLDALVVTWEKDSGDQAIARDEACTAEGYRLDFSLPGGGTSVDPQRILLCGDSCTAVQADSSSAISVDFGCIGQ